MHGETPLLYFTRMKSTALVSVLEMCLPISMLLQSTALLLASEVCPADCSLLQLSVGVAVAQELLWFRLLSHF